jgi:AmmeMemoRadiSam system protein A
MRGSPDGARAAGAGGTQSVLSLEQKQALRELAFSSIRHGLAADSPLRPESYPADHPFSKPGAVFVTLKKGGELRGCVGSFEAKQALALDVAKNAYSAAFMDFRFPPITESELDELDLHLSLLTPLEPMAVKTRSELLASLRPGHDGLLLEALPHRATFLPQVWETLPKPNDFVEELFIKAGLSKDYWSESIRFHRYSVEEF